MKTLDILKVGLTAGLLATATFPAQAQDKANLDESVGFIAAQNAGEIRAAKWLGVSVKNKAGKTVGDINDLILDKNLKVVAVVVGAGGFLGIAEKNVAIPVDKVSMTTTKDNARVAVIPVNKEALENAADYKFANDKTLRERLGDMGDAASETYSDAKKAAKDGYDNAKKAVSESMADEDAPKSDTPNE